MTRSFALDEVIDDYEDETHIQTKKNVVRNSTYDRMELNYEGDIEGFLNEWQYRKTHNVTGSTDGAQTDYQVSITVYYGSGSDSGSSVYLDSKCQVDFDDVRFTEDDGITELDYWIETKVNGDNAVIWVKINDIPSNPNDALIYIYYGNSEVATTSNGDNTFPILFDDFEDGTVGQYPSGWTKNVGSAGDYFYVSNSVVKGGTKSAVIHEEAVTPDGRFIKTPGTCEDVVLHLWFRYVTAAKRVYPPALLNGINFLMRDDVGDWRYYNRAAWTTIPNWSNPTQGIWYRLELFYDESTDKVLYLKDRTENSGWTTSPSIWGVGGIGLIQIGGVYSYATDAYIDEVYVRMYANPEPTHAEWGSEEEYPGYSESGYFYTKNLIENGSTIVLLTNSTMNDGILKAEFSDDNSTWVNHDDESGSDTLIEGLEAIDLRDLDFDVIYIRFNFTRGGLFKTPYLDGIRVINSGVPVGDGEGPGEDYFIFLPVGIIFSIVIFLLVARRR